jgi:putative transposase
MARNLRRAEPGTIYHVLNRGTGRRTLFRKEGDFCAFLTILAQGLERYPVDLLAYCLMGNHWHLLLRPRTGTALSALMRWVTTTHARRLHAHLGGRGGGTQSGHVYQGRFKSFPVQPDDWHFLAVARYVEANPLRAKLVARAEDWEWSSLVNAAGRQCGLRLAEWPVERPRRWRSAVNGTWDNDEAKDANDRNGAGGGASQNPTLAPVRDSVARGRPFGDATWRRRAAARMGLQGTLLPIGRPRKPLEALSARQRRRRLKEVERGESRRRGQKCD